jgi:hypothetical protein
MVRISEEQAAKEVLVQNKDKLILMHLSEVETIYN